MRTCPSCGFPITRGNLPGVCPKCDVDLVRAKLEAHVLWLW